MKPDYDSLINAGLSKEEIAKISGCEDQEMQIRMLRKYRYKLLDRCTFWNISDCCKWCCTKYLVVGCAGGSCYGAHIYNGHWTVYGKWRCRCCGA